MADADEIPRRLPYVFRGGLAFNQRTVAGAVGLLTTKASATTAINNQPIRLADITNVLLLLESIAMSNEIILDGTLPPSDIEELQAALSRLADRSGIALEVEFLHPPADTLASMFKDAAEAAA